MPKKVKVTGQVVTRSTQRDVARAAGVSQAAVSRVFMGNGYVAQDVRARILKAAEDVGYRIDEVGRTLARGVSNIVAILVANVANPFYPYVIQLLTSRLQQAGCEVLILNAANENEFEELVPLVLKYRARGAIITTSPIHSTAAELLRSEGTPVVNFNRYTSPNTTHAVACDNESGGFIAAHRLIAAGCKRLVYVGGEENASTNADRQRGFERRLAQDAIKPVDIVGGQFSYDWGRRSAATLLLGKQSFDGAFCGDDVIAFGVIDELRSRGKAIPQDVSVIGFDDVPSSSWGAYQLTTLRQPIEAMIAAAIELLSLPADAPAQMRLVGAELIERNTVRRGG